MDDALPAAASRPAEPAAGMAHHLTRRGGMVVLAVVVVAAAALRFTHLTSQSLWLDEGYTLEYARTATLGAFLRQIFQCTETECMSPLYPLLLHPIIQWLGESVLVLRGFSAVCGVAAVAVLIRAARTLFDRPTSLLAGAMMAVSAYAVWYSQDARHYSLLLLLVSLELWGLALCLDPASARPRRSHRLLLAAAVALGIFGNILFAMSAAALSIGHIAVARDPRRWWATWWPAAAGALPPLAWFVATQLNAAAAATALTRLVQSGFVNFAYAVYGLLVGITYGPPQAALRGGDGVAGLGGHLAALVCAGVLLVLLVVAVVTATRFRTPTDRRWSHQWMLLISAVTATAMAIAFVYFTRMNWLPRHSFFFFPPLVLIVSFSLRVLAGHRWAWARGLSAVTVSLFVFTNAWGLYNYFADPQYSKDDYRGVAHYLAEAHRHDERSALLYGRMSLLRYYGDTVTVDLTEVEGPDLVRRLTELSGREKGVLVALNREFYWLDGIGVRAALGEMFEIRDHEKRQYFDVYRVVPREQ